MNKKKSKKDSCDCNICKAACKIKPGWFKPDEAEKVAEYLGITMQKLFDEYLAVDWYRKGGVDYFPLSPAAKKNPKGAMWPYDPRGECVFFENGKCKIHPVAPFECREYYHTDTPEDIMSRHEQVAKSWNNKKKYIEKLLGHAPYPPEQE
jgi:Fe-S-cluster containining protein